MSNETPKTSPEKIKLAHRFRENLIYFVVFVLSLMGLMGYVMHVNMSIDPPYVGIGNDRLPVEVADDTDELIRGLSGRPKLADGTGMLFVFPEPDQQCIWMKDMRFAIDIVWLNEFGGVIDVKSKAPPESYPEQFCSSEAAMYVLELPAGEATLRGIDVGDSMRIVL